MTARAAAGLEVLEKVQWFSRVGIDDTKSAVFLSSWSEAREYCSHVNVRNFGLAASNQYTCALEKAAPERYKKWSDLWSQMEPKIKDLVKRKTQDVVQQHNLPKPFFKDMVETAIGMACIELEYADVHPPGFYANLAYWYVKGHFPCAWKGIKYKGKPIPGQEFADMYPAGFYDKIAKWYEKGDFGDWQGDLPQGKLIIY